MQSAHQAKREYPQLNWESREWAKSTGRYPLISIRPETPRRYQWTAQSIQCQSSPIQGYTRRFELAHNQGGHYKDYNLSPLLYTHRLDDAEHISLEVWSAPNHSKPGFEEAKRQSYRKAQKGESFGPSWTNHWFKVTLHIPKDWQDYERVQLEFDCSGEAMVFTTDGDPINGT